MAMVRPAPALKPTRMLSLISFTSALRRNSQAKRQSTATVKRCEAGDLRVALRVTVRHRSHGTGDHERNGGSRPDRELARGAEQGVAQAAEQIAIDAHLRRQACKPRIGKRNRNRVGGQGYPGNDIAGQPGGAVLRQPAGRRKPPEPGRICPVFRRIRHAAPQAANRSELAYRPGGLLDSCQRIRTFDPDGSLQMIVRIIRGNAQNSQLILAAAMRQNRFFFVIKSPRNDPGIVSASPHEIFLSSHRQTQKAAAFVCRRTQRGTGGATEDQVCVRCLRFAGRFVSSHWHCVRLPSLYPSRRLQHDLTTAQGDTLAPITPAIMQSGTTPITIIGTRNVCRAGSAASRGCRPAALPTRTQAFHRTQASIRMQP